MTPRDIAAYHLGGPVVSATLVKVGENMGDHAQDIRVALQIGPGETVEALAHRALKRSWTPREHIEYDWRVEISMVLPYSTDGAESAAPGPI